MDLHPYDKFSARQLGGGRRSERRLAIWFGLFVVVLLGGTAAAMYVAYDRNQKEYDRFMRGCMEDHKEYECTAIWRAGRRSDPDVVVLPVPVQR